MPSTNPEKLRLNWMDVSNAAHHAALSMATTDFTKPTVIVCIARGGLIPGAMLSHILGVDDLRVIRVASYTNEHIKKEDGYLMFTNPATGLQLDEDEFTRLYNWGHVLIVDDILDTGATMKRIHELVPDAFTLTLFHKKPTTEELEESGVDFPGYILPADKWAVFPWELK